MNQIDSLAKFLAEWSSDRDIHVYGQNLTQPSFISGIGKYFSGYFSSSTCRSFFDTTNSELTSVGYGIGRSIMGKDSLLVVKQQDFLYLALDQFVNSLCNIPAEIDDYGVFTILCLVSDVPLEGTQAWSNNTSLFASLPPNCEVSYCYTAKMLEAVLSSRTSHYRLVFLSMNYIYRSQALSNLLSASSAPPIWHSGTLGESNTQIFLGFVDEHYTHALAEPCTIIVPARIHDPELSTWIVRHISNFNLTSLTIVESTTSTLSLANNLGYSISRETGICLSTINTRKISSNGFSLCSQLPVRSS